MYYIIFTYSRKAQTICISLFAFLCFYFSVFFFFFQAEDGIRDLTVTGVQTCALPISSPGSQARDGLGGGRRSHPRPLGQADAVARARRDRGHQRRRGVGPGGRRKDRKSVV